MGMCNEIWNDIKGYEGLYQVSNLGRVKSLARQGTKGVILKPVIAKGYIHYPLTKDKKTKWYYAHRLVAEQFIPNPDKLPEVNHKDECKANNQIENLEWCTKSYNSNYGTRKERISNTLKRITNRPS